MSIKHEENIPKYKGEEIMIDQDLYKKQLEFIRKEAEGDSFLIGSLESIEVLQSEFANNTAFLQKLHIFEQIVLRKDTQLYQEILAIIKQSKSDLMSVGYEEMVLDDFYDTIIEKLELIVTPDFSPEQLISIFCDTFVSDSLVMYLRFMTSGYLKMNVAVFENYLENGQTIDRFCACEVDPIDKEADQIPMMALIDYLKVPIKIIYLDSNIKKVQPDIIILPEGSEKSNIFVNLLYRPGHYDIVYSSS